MEIPHAWLEAAYAAMLRKLRKEFGEKELIYDAAADRLLEIWRKRGLLVASEGEFVALCLKGVVWRARDLMRWPGGRRRKRVPLEEVADRRDGFGVRELEAMLRALLACLSQMPDRGRLVLELYYFDGRSDRDIAQRLAGLSDPEVGRGAVQRRENGPSNASQRAIEAARKAVSRERFAALGHLRKLIESEMAWAERLAA